MSQRSFAFLILFFTAMLVVAAAEPARVIDARRYHLGVAGMPEWEEFAASAPHGPQLAITFTATPNAREVTLFIWQREVKTAWNVMLNGRKLGALETLSQPLLLALPVPAGALKDGENRLVIARPPTRILDDIEVGELTLDMRPRAEALADAALDVVVTDGETGGAVPCRLTLVDAHDALMPWQADEGQRLAVRTGVVYTGDGRARVRTRPGAYVLYANRGFEYSVARASFRLKPGDPHHVALQIRREVPTPGFVACDSHIHTLTFSKHGDATIDERMLTIAGEGIEVAIATDHNHHTDYSEPAARNAVQPYFTSVVGNEVTTNVGHFNAFPVPPGGPVPDATITDWTKLLLNVRALTGAKVVTLNHPRDLHAGFTPFGPENFDGRTGELKPAADLRCDAVEVVTSAAMQSDLMQLYRDWFALLNHGLRIAAIAASDTHQVSEFILGQARTYVACSATDPSRISIDEICESYRSGRLLVSLGLLTTMSVNERFTVGDLATELPSEMNVKVEVFGPSWVRADRVELFANGIRIAGESIRPSDHVQKARVEWRIPRPRHDVHLVAIATGPGVTEPYWEIARPYQPTSQVFTPRIVGSTNPIWIDGDGDGRFTAARGYAAMLMERTGGDPAKLQAELSHYDAAVAVQAADLMERRR